MTFTTRPVIMGTHGVVTSSHYLASEAGLQTLRRGGNVVDAGITMWLCLTVLKPYLVGFAGEVPILLYLADEDKVLAVNGQGPAPKGATLAWFAEHGYRLIPEDGFLPAVVPGAFDAWVKVLDEYGSLSLEEALEPAMRMAEEGFPVFPSLNAAIARSSRRFRTEWPTSAEVYLPNGKVPEIGSLLTNPPLARTYRRIAEAEKEGRRYGRSAGLKAGRDYFYGGPVAKAIVEYMQSFSCRDAYGQEHHGLLDMEDLARYEARIEDPLTVNYRGHDVYKCSFWTQGPVMLEHLNLLEGFDLRGMGHNSIEYLHTWVECAKLSFADREQYYGDPDFVKLPEMLLTKEYADERRSLVDPSEASMELRPGGVPPIRMEETAGPKWYEHGSWKAGDTVHLEAVDGTGNMLSATPSGGWIPTSPLVPDLGFPMGTRGQMFHLDPNHVERLEPGKKPSTTLTPSLVIKDGEPYMVFGTPGGDQQDQWSLQVLLNHLEFGMDVQLAIDMPSVHSTHFPSSFWPHDAHPGVVHLESRIPEMVIEGLKKKGHRVIVDDPWSHGRCLAIRYNRETGVIFGGASPRTGDPYAVGW